MQVCFGRSLFGQNDLVSALRKRQPCYGARNVLFIWSVNSINNPIPDDTNNLPEYCLRREKEWTDDRLSIHALCINVKRRWKKRNCLLEYNIPESTADHEISKEWSGK